MAEAIARRLFLTSLPLLLAHRCPVAHAWPSGSTNPEQPPAGKPDERPSESSDSSDLSGPGCLRADRSFAGSGAAALQLTRRTGNQFVDAGFGRVSQDLIQIFRAQPGLCFMVEPSGPNAFATPQNVAGFGGADGTVVFGRRLVLDEMKSAPQTWGSALALIAAHEWAHIVQFRRIRNLGGGKRPELHADMLAGWFIAVWNRQVGVPANSPIDITTSGVSIFKKGDYTFSSRGHHGTPEDRYVALIGGYRLAEKTGDDFSVAFDQAWKSPLVGL